jgi:DNA-binding transcriptional MerR regulator
VTDGITLAELAEKSGTPARTIRFYISRGLVDGPVKAGRSAAYTASHLERLRRIKQLQAEGHALSEIAPLLGLVKAPSVRPSSWWQYQIAEDVVVWTRADMSPWRARQVRAAIEDLTNRLGTEQEDEK